MNDQKTRDQFERTVLPHRDAAYNLALWLMRRPDDAEDVVQESLLRAYKYFDGFRGENAKAWLLVIVRNACNTWFQQHPTKIIEPLGDENDWPDEREMDPETYHQKNNSEKLVRKAVAELPVEFREVVVLRELEGLSYKEISDVIKLPIGTVMSRLSRGRDRLKASLEELRSSI